MSAYDPLRLIADIEVHLHQLGVSTVAGGAVSAAEAAGDLLRALGVDPVDEHRAVQYRVRLVEVRQGGVSADERHAEDFAHALRMLPAARAGRASVLVDTIAAPVRGEL